jgi:HAD superfamily hydrolase (TIGR01509 family)
MNERLQPRVLFIDDGGVMNDNTLRAAEWQRFVSEFMPHRLGGDAKGWAEANGACFRQVWARFSGRLDTFESHAAFQREYDIDWVSSMCDYLGLATPPEDESLKLAREAVKYITSRAHAADAGAAEAIRALREAGYQLHTASGETSWELHGYLTGMGVRDCFTHLFGPDLVDCMKAGSEYYRRAFASAGVEPGEAIVIDDSESACAWASAAGADVVHVGSDATSLAELAQRLTGAAVQA